MPAPDDPLQSLRWLAGHWQNATFEAHYTGPENGVIISASKSLDPRDAGFFELERFTVQDGVVVVVPYPMGRASVPFRRDEATSGPTKARFVNPDHDWPQELTYRRVGPDQLVITASGPGKEPNDPPRVLTFDLQRASRAIVPKTPTGHLGTGRLPPTP